MRQATKDAAPAIPCWVMPIEKVAELIGYPTDKSDRFDVVIIDEASQAWFPSAFLYAITEQVIVVADHLQTSPSDTSVTEDGMVRLLHQHIADHKLVNKLDGEFSLYDVAAEITAPSVMVDHFRCVPPIIELSACSTWGVPETVPSRLSETRSRTERPASISLGMRFQQRLIWPINPSISDWLRRAEVPVVSPKVGEPPWPVVPPREVSWLMIDEMSSAGWALAVCWFAC
jgi:hypothetical protein